MMQLTTEQVFHFREIIWDHYRRAGRSMPWRENPEPYWVWVSELMLQQTQVSRVQPKFEQFIGTLPDVQSLAAAPLGEVLRLWNGLGYNRRAKFLHAAAGDIVTLHNCNLPHSFESLVALPGIGPNTAGAILTYAYNQPVIFIETNIRSVYFHHFFAGQTGIDDKALRPLIEQTLDHEHPRQWYWALMDYGAYLKKTVGNDSRRSKQYNKQSKFAGSDRQVRGEIIRQLLAGPMAHAALLERLQDVRGPRLIQQLMSEGFIQEQDGLMRLTDSPALADNNR